MTYRTPFCAALLALTAMPLWVQAEARLYGEVHVSIDYVDADPDATWYRPAPGGPAFDFQGFADGANQVLADSGYVGIPGPEGINTAIADIMFGTIPFDTLSPEVQAGILDVLHHSLTSGAAFKGWGLNMSDRASRLGVQGSEDLGNGLKALYQIELEIPVANKDADIDNGDPGLVRMRNSFLGLEGGWGRLIAGRHDSPLKMSTAPLDLFADTLADYNRTIGFSDLRSDNSLLYFSPAFWGVQVTGAVIPGGGATVLGVEDPRANGLAEGWSVAANYGAGPFYASAAYERLARPLWRWQDGLYDTSHGIVAGDETRWRFGLGLLDWNGIDLTGIYESRSQVMGQTDNAGVMLWQVQGAYRFGGTRIKAMYGQALPGACVDPMDLGFRFACSSGVVAGTFGDALGPFVEQGDKSAWAVGVDHDFSTRSRLYALYTALTDSNPAGDWSGFSLGMLHRF